MSIFLTIFLIISITVLVYYVAAKLEMPVGLSSILLIGLFLTWYITPSKPRESILFISLATAFIIAAIALYIIGIPVGVIVVTALAAGLVWLHIMGEDITFLTIVVAPTVCFIGAQCGMFGCYNPFYLRRKAERERVVNALEWASNQKQLANKLKDCDKIFQDFTKLLLHEIPKEHLNVLVRKSNILIIEDEYGSFDDSRWKQEMVEYVNKYAISKKTKGMFLKLKRSFYSYVCAEKGVFFNLSNNEDAVLNNLIYQIAENLGSMIIDSNNRKIVADKKLFKSLPRPSDPIEYESYCGNLLKKAGWRVSHTKASGDQGADLIAKKGERVLLVQCKLYNTPVGNKAVQEIVSALNYYGGNEGAVVTNSGFTNSAKILAKANKIKLIHDSQLESL